MTLFSTLLLPVIPCYPAVECSLRIDVYLDFTVDLVYSCRSCGIRPRSPAMKSNPNLSIKPFSRSSSRINKNTSKVYTMLTATTVTVSQFLACVQEGCRETISPTIALAQMMSRLVESRHAKYLWVNRLVIGRRCQMNDKKQNEYYQPHVCLIFDTRQTPKALLTSLLFWRPWCLQ